MHEASARLTARTRRITGPAYQAPPRGSTVLPIRVGPIAGARSAGTGNPDGSIAVQGDFVTDSSAPKLDVFSTAAGVELAVTDGLGSSVTTAPSLLPADCATKPSGVVKCKSADKTVTATFKPVSTASTSKPWIFRLGVKKLSASGPLVGPVSVTLRSSGDVDRADAIGACGLSPSGILSCRRY